MDTVRKFSSLFQGRTDFVGAEEGGCVRIHGPSNPDDFHWMYQGHLTGSRPPIGIYPVVRRERLAPDGAGRIFEFAVKFGAVDIDFEDLPLAKNVWHALQALSISAWVERSRSKGYHVWIFADDWVPAVLVRSTLQVACDVAGYSPKEIFPKQTELTDGSPGNYIRLPYPGALLREVSEASRRVVLQMDRPSQPLFDLEDWVESAWNTRVSRDRLEQAAVLAAPPKPKHRPPLVRPGTPAEEPDKALVATMGGLSYTIWANGPLDGQDRSGTLFKLTHSLKKDGFTADQTFSLVRNADARWGKFFDRADGDDRLWEIVERVYDE